MDVFINKFGFNLFVYKNRNFRRKILYIVCYYDGYLYWNYQLNSLFNLKQLLIWMTIIFSSLLKHFNNDYNYEEIVIEQLKPGMITNQRHHPIYFLMIN